MQKRLKWFSHQIRYSWPGNWKIKYRLLAAGFALSALALLTPMYMRAKLASLSDTYAWSSRNWETLDRIHQFSRLITDSESKLRAFATSGNRDWLNTIAKNNLAMDAIQTELFQTAAEKAQHSALLREASGAYQAWVKDVAARFVDPRNPGAASASAPTPSAAELAEYARQLMGEPNALRVTGLLGDLARDIHDNNVVAHRAVAAASEHALLVVTYGGLFFFLGFATLILSLWMTLIPSLNVLLASARELKRGNLDHRVHLDGRSETAILGRAFNEMAISLKAQNEKLKELNRMKSDFVSTVSHELRTPLTAIKGSIGLILGNVTGPIPGETAEMLKITQKNTDRLIRLINEVLDVAKIEAGAIQMRFDKYSMVDTIAHAVMGIEGFAQTQGIKVVWDKPQASPLIVVDRDRIEQVITNLMSNAIKFTEPGGSVTVKCEWEADRVVVQVADTGQGIPEEFLERIFQKFQQADGHAHKQKEGTGLGLTIAKAIVEEHGGQIWVTSKVGQGSTFSFSLPWNGTEFVEPAKKSTDKAAAKGKKHLIFLVDNEPDFTTVIQKLLQHEGYDVTAINSGKDCVEQAMKSHPDLIILDIMMPDMDGLTVRKVLAESPKTKSIPIVFVTVSPEIHAEMKEQAEVKVITKPIMPDELKSWLKTFFSQRETTGTKKAA